MYKYYQKTEKREKLKEDILNLNHTPAAVVCEDRQFHAKVRKHIASALLIAGMLFLLTGCGHVTEEMKAGKENGIALMENGDYEGAVAEFDSLIDQTKHVSSFEIDVLKYRGEAEFMLGDYGAAAYTYDTLVKVDKPRAEYDSRGAVSLANSGDMEGAENRLESGTKVDEKHAAAGYAEAMEALGAAYMTAGDEITRKHCSTGKRDLHSPMTGRRRRSPSTRRCVTSTWGSMRKRWSCSGAMRNSTDRMRKRIMRSRFL